MIGFVVRRPLQSVPVALAVVVVSFLLTVLTETVFSYPGLGRLTFDAILARDHPLLLGLFIAISFFVVVVNLLTDLIYAAVDYAAVDPRVRTA